MKRIIIEIEEEKEFIKCTSKVYEENSTPREELAKDLILNDIRTLGKKLCEEDPNCKVSDAIQNFLLQCLKN